MKLIFKPDGTLWIIDNSGRHKDVAGHESVVAPQEFDPVKQQTDTEDGVVTVYKTLDEVKSELELSNA